MFSSREVMTELDNIATKLFIVGNIDLFLVINEPVLLFPFKEAIQELIRFFGFERLECLSYRRLAIKAVLDVLFKQ
jgi:hypothetical protein